ncbi:hypothetical protein [Paraburkholderia sp. BCC1886]|uniref:hypothetical protein n=1 Tax=Paraburkholderia sp. BCC1886 TaxID=2562670 RepID=UPI001183199C|nr:hypothetical protein [Paraburkholderia sp. BCC1886]
MRLRDLRLSVAVENVDFQSDAFFREVTAIFRDLKSVPVDQIPDHESALQLPAVIAHYSGLNVKIAWWDEGFMVTPPMVNKNNPLLSRWADWFRQSIVSNEDGDKIIATSKTKAIGNVNVKNGMVSGVFSTIVSTLYMVGADIVGKRFEPEELAAIVLHEMGHLFTYYLVIAKTLSTNMILAGLSKKLDQTLGPKDREAVLVKVKSVAQLAELDTEALSRSNDKKVIEVVVVSNIAKSIQSEIGSNLYDISACEMMADQYAARLGAGRFLVTALDKYKRSPSSTDIRYRSTMGYLVIEAYKLLLLAGGPFSFGLSWLLLLIHCAADGVDKTGEYDNDANRYGRIREHIVEAMKSPKLSTEQQSSYAEDLLVIDDIKQFASNRQQLLGYVHDFISPIQRKRISQEKLQRELESIANNDLFVKAAALRQLSA